MDLEKPIADLGLILRGCTESAWVPPIWAVNLMAIGLANWHREEIPEPTQRAWMRLWEIKAREVGPAAIEKAMSNALLSSDCEFFPSPEKLFGYLPEVSEVIAPSYNPPTAEELAFRGSEEQREEWRKVKAKADEVSKLPSRVKETRPYIPTPAELAKELAENPLGEVLGWRKKEQA